MERARHRHGNFLRCRTTPDRGSALRGAAYQACIEAIKFSRIKEGAADIPSYRSLDFYPPDRVQAALSRRIFDAASEAETVDYAHRTTAEYLAAEFLASRIRGGLPFGRVAALMGVDGHPASELRGLHAWLAVHLPEHADELIEADPYGVLSYGDAASLSASCCANLVRALDRLSRTNPWFRSGALAKHPRRGTARAVAEFRAMLNNPGSGFGVRSVVVDALALGQPLPAMLPDLQTVLARQASPFAERVHALDALLRLGDAGKQAVRAVFDGQQLGSSENDLRLRAAILQPLYGDPYRPDAVIALVQDLFDSDSTMSGTLWGLADKLPDRDVPAILDGIAPPAQEHENYEPPNREAGAFYARILARAWQGSGAIAPARVMGWLNKRIAFRGGPGESRAQGLREAMQATRRRGFPCLSGGFL